MSKNKKGLGLLILLALGTLWDYTTTFEKYVLGVLLGTAGWGVYKALSLVFGG